MVFVIRDKKILMEKIFYNNRFFYTIPGGGIEEGETPEEVAIRELKEECGLEGTIAKKLTELFKSDGSTEYVFEVNVPKYQSPIVGFDPEEPEDNQPIKDVCWMKLDQLSEKDRAFLWSYGLMEIDGFFDEILRWGDSISYPLYY
jgi:8-oxo-dGTP pyrophosphatase MutT (NUDIX family)